MDLESLVKEGWQFRNLGCSSNTKFADSLDKFFFYFRCVNPRTENFCLSATFEVADASQADFQTGYGIMVADTVETPDKGSCHRNYAMVGRSRTLNGQNYGLQLRVVGGYTNPLAYARRRQRRLDPSRTFRMQPSEDSLKKGDRHHLRLIKTDEGLEASLITDSGVETIRFPGCDFLLRQDKSSVYVGFAVAGKIKLNLSDITFEKSAGVLSHTPEDAIRNFIPDYPFSREMLKDPDLKGIVKLSGQKLVVSATGDSLTLDAAIRMAGPGCEIVLKDGIYTAREAYYVPKSYSGTKRKPVILRAEHPGKAVLDGSAISVKLPAMTLRADWWVIEGLIFRGAPSSGLFICGSHNRVNNCDACWNGDTGILLCAFPGVSRKEWPNNNLIESCSSYCNCDTVRCNADGFGAKLSVGWRNVFRSCRAFNNIDDGFDLYTKQPLGPIGPVIFINCEAFSNGWLPDEPMPGRPARCGCGFKLGGEEVPVSHILIACSAHNNARIGFHRNTNPLSLLFGCKEWGNGPA